MLQMFVYVHLGLYPRPYTSLLYINRVRRNITIFKSHTCTRSKKIRPAPCFLGPLLLCSLADFSCCERDDTVRLYSVIYSSDKQIDANV
jgi:hypothetical protein